MSRTIIRQRADEFEEAFFLMADAELLLAVHQHVTLNVDGDTMAQAAGLTDRTIIDELQKVEITPKTLMALSLFPAIHVAWADGKIATREKDAILKSAEKLGIASGTPAFDLLRSWLDHEPSAELFAAWSEFIHAARGVIHDSVFQELKIAATKRAIGIAEAAGGVLGFHRISATEQSAIKDIETTFLNAIGAG